MQFASGSVTALMRPDVAIAVALTQLDVAVSNSSQDLNLVVVSLEQ